MSIQWTKELLEECRNERGVVFGMMSKAAQEAIEENRCKSEFYGLLNGVGWKNKCDSATWFCPANAYRLSPSYTPPELQEKKFFDVKVERNGNKIRYRDPYLCSPVAIGYAVNMSKFYSYVYADGTLDIIPRRLKEDGPAEVPVAVRFWKEA